MHALRRFNLTVPAFRWLGFLFFFELHRGKRLIVLVKLGHCLSACLDFFSKLFYELVDLTEGCGDCLLVGSEVGAEFLIPMGKVFDIGPGPVGLCSLDPVLNRLIG